MNQKQTLNMENPHKLHKNNIISRYLFLLSGSFSASSTFILNKMTT